MTISISSLREMSPPTAYIGSTTHLLTICFFAFHTDGCKQSDSQTQQEETVTHYRNYLLVQHHSHRTNLLVHMNSCLQYANTKPTSPCYINYSYILNPTYCEGTLRIFDPIKNYFSFLPLNAKIHRPILVPIECLQCVEGSATK